MPKVGSYYGGTKFIENPAGGAGVRITAISPASETSFDADMGENRTINGTKFSEGIEVGAFGDTSNGYDSGTTTVSLPTSYTDADNVDPGNTGVPITIPAGEETTLVKTVADNWEWRVSILRHWMPIHVVAQTPPTDALPPAIGATSKVSRFTKADIDLTILPNEVGFAISSFGLLNKWRWNWQFQRTRRPAMDRFTPNAYELSYARDSSKVAIEALLAQCLDINSTDKEFLAAWTVIHAENIVQQLENGMRYNFPETDGGVQNGRKMIVCMAAMLTGDALFTSWAHRTDWAIEDTYCQYITQAHLDAYGAGLPGVTDGFLAEDLGIPWWFPGPNAPQQAVKSRPIRAISRSSYQEMFFVNMVGFYALCGLIPGMQAMWNNQVVFDWLDRTCYRTLYNDPATEVGWGLRSGGTNNVSHFSKDLFNAFAPAPVWDWPA